MIAARVLQPDEWMQMGGELPKLLPFVLPENAAVVVVEDGSRPVATMGVLRVTHYEGVWIDPEYAGNLGVTRSLLRTCGSFPAARGERFVFGGAADDRMRGILDRMGGVRMPLDFYALSIGGQECRQQ